MTYPITPVPSIHDAPASDKKTENDLIVAQIRNIFGQLPQMILSQVIAYIKTTTGIDLSGFLTLLNGAGTALGMLTPLTSFLPNLEKALSGIDLSNPGSVITFLQSLLQSIPLSHIGQTNPELLTNPSFQGAISVNGGTDWSYDATTGHTANGCVKAVGNGTAKVLRSNAVKVTSTDQLALSVWVKWSGITFTGTPFKLQVVRLLAGAVVGTDDIASPTSPGTNQASFIQLVGATYSVPAGCDQIVLQLSVSSTLTAGSVWFDDGSVTKVGILSGDWVTGLQNTLKQDMQSLTDAIQQATQGGSATGNPFSAANIKTWLSSIPPANVTGLTSLLAGLVSGTTFTQLLTDLQTGTTAVLTGPVSELVTGLAAARQAIAQGLGLTTSSGLSNTAAQNFAANVATVANQAAAAAASANATLASQQAVTNANNGGGGNHALLNPSGADGAAISSSIASSTGVTSGDLCIRGSNGYIGIKSGLTVPAIAYGILNFTYAGDDQSLILSLGDQGALNTAATYGYMHSDTGHTVGAYIKVANDTITIGSYTRSGGTYTYTPFSSGSVSTTVSGNDSVEFRNVGTSWSVLVGGSFVINGLANSGITFSSARRSAAVSMERKHSAGFFGWGAGDFDSFRLAGVYLSDLVTPAYVGSTAKMIRTATANVTVNNSTVGPIALPGSFFGSVSRASADITASLTNGTFTVVNAGTYKISFRAKLGTGWTCSTTDISAEYGPCVQVNGTTVEYGRMNTSFLTAASDLILSALSMESQFQVYLNAGDVVRIAIVAPANSVLPATSGLVGTTDGFQTYFSIGLMNKSLA